MVNMTDGPDVQVRLVALELLFGHGTTYSLLMCYSPRTRAMISVAIDSGTAWYESNCIVYVARPCVRDRRSPTYPNICANGTFARITCALPRCSMPST